MISVIFIRRWMAYVFKLVEKKATNQIIMFLRTGFILYLYSKLLN